MEKDLKVVGVGNAMVDILIRVEDLFFITDKQGQPIVRKADSDKICDEIKHQLENKL